MKKTMKIIAMIAILGTTLFLLTGCGEKEETKGDKEKGENEVAYKVTYKGVDITPGVTFKEGAISEEPGVMELQSCAFDGADRVYTYEGVELTVSEMKGVATVYSVYFLDETVQTKEGVSISDGKSKMIEAYGEDYEQMMSKYTYQSGDIELAFIVENDIIISIEYIYNI